MSGGLSSVKHNELWYIEKEQGYQWKMLKFLNNPIRMHSHTVNFYKSNLYLFGGVSDDATRQELIVVDLSLFLKRIKNS